MRLTNLLEDLNDPTDTTFTGVRGRWLKKNYPNAVVETPSTPCTGIRLVAHSGDEMMTSLKGVPKIIKGGVCFFDCSHNLLIDLEHGPEVVEGDYDCSYNKLISLKGAPETIKGKFDCGQNSQLTSLKGGPKEVGSFMCNGPIVSLEGVPAIVHNELAFHSSVLTSFHDIYKHVKQARRIICDDVVVSHILGLLKIKGLEEFMMISGDGKTSKNDYHAFKLTKIINKHLRADRSIFACQADLEDEGFEEFAQL